MSRRIARVDLSGERARLRLHRADDAAAAFLLLDGQDEILRWLLWDGPTSPVELAEHYRHGNPFDGSPTLALAVEERASGALAGSLSLRFGVHPGQADVGYWIGTPFQGRGLGREAVALAARLAFLHLRARALEAWVFVGNVASRRVLEHAGFTLERTVPGRARKRGRRIDQWQFVLSLADWRRLCAGFRPVHEAVEWREDEDGGLELPIGLTSPAEALARLARGEVARAVVPVANSTSGLVPETIAALGGRGLVLDGEIVLPVRLSLWVRDVRAGAASIDRVASHPQALRQCRRTLLGLLGGYEELPWGDTASAAQALAAGELGTGTAVLASRRGGALAGLHALRHDVHDEPDNRTFFAVLRRSAESAVE